MAKSKMRTISPLDALIAKMQGGNGATGHYDPGLAAAIQAAVLGKADIERAFGQTTEEAKIGFDEMRQQLQKQKVEGYENNEGNFSGNGLLRSGIFATEQGKVGTQFQEGLTAAAARRQAMIQNATNQRLSGLNQLQAGLAGAQASATERAQANAQAAAAQRLATQQAQQLAAIQQSGIANQQNIAQQQLELYRQQMGSTGQSGAKTMAGPSMIDKMRENQARMSPWLGGGGGNKSTLRQGPPSKSPAINRRLGLPSYFG